MANFPEPFNPVGSYDPCYMKNTGNWNTAWNTAIYGVPTQTGANVLSNCVGYTQGRMLYIYNYITGYNPAQTQTHPFIDFNIEANAGWYYLAESKGYETLSEPEEGCVLVTGSHVAVVERLKNDTEWWVSASGYNSYAYQYANTLHKEGNKWYDYGASDREVIGFFRIPETSPGPGPGPTPAEPMKWIYYLKNWNND